MTHTSVTHVDTSTSSSPEDASPLPLTTSRPLRSSASPVEQHGQWPFAKTLLKSSHSSQMLLTERQRYLLAMHANGETIQDIASSLGYAYITIRKDAENAKKILGAGTLAHAVAQAFFHREIALDPDGVVVAISELSDDVSILRGLARHHDWSVLVGEREVPDLPHRPGGFTDDAVTERPSSTLYVRIRKRELYNADAGEVEPD